MATTLFKTAAALALCSTLSAAEPGIAIVGHEPVLAGNAKIEGTLRIDPSALPVVDPPPSPSGTRKVTANQPNAEVGDFRTIRDLTVAGNGSVRVPPGNYGVAVANGNGAIVLGRSGSSAPLEYGFERLLINGNGRLEVEGPVLVRIALGFYSGRATGAAANPGWLSLRIAGGEVTISSNAAVFGFIAAPKSVVSINGNAVVTGGMAADRLRMEGNAKLRILPSPPTAGRPPGIPYASGFEPAEGFQAGGLTGQLGWTATMGSPRITAVGAFEGLQAVEISDGDFATAGITLPGAEPSVTFVDAFVQPHAPVPGRDGTFVDLSGGLVRLASDGDSARWEARDGESWRSIAQPVSVDVTGASQDWARLTGRLSFGSSRWDLYLNSRLLLEDLEFPSPAPARATHFAFGGPGPSKFDLVFAGYENPVFDDADADGIEDAWEIVNQLDPAIDDRSADRDSDGLTNLREYISGTRANLADTDRDGVDDGAELAIGRNPLAGTLPDNGSLRLKIYRPQP